MARPRKSTSGTSFGKRSGAEKSFRNRKKEKPEGRFGDERQRRSFKKDDGERSPRFSRSDKPGFEKRQGSFSRPGKFTKRSGSDETPGFRKSSFDKPGFGEKSGSRFNKGPRFEKKKFDSDKEDRSFNRPGKLTRRSDSDETPDFKKRSFNKPGFGEKSGGRFNKGPRFDNKRKFDSNKEDRPFKKEGFEKSDRDNRFEKKRFDRDEKPAFKKRESGRFDSRTEGPARFVKKPFGRRDNDQEGDKPRNTNYGLPYKRKPYNKLRDVKSPRRTPRETTPKTDSDLIRLNKFIANSGVGSRREADELIKLGLITVNGEVVTEMGHKVKVTDDVRYEGKRLKAESPVYILLNKPKGFITTTDDPQERKTVMNLVANAGKERIYPVGRLDRNTTGLLLLTNDGDLADKLTHPSYNVKKIYKVELDKPITKNDFQKIKDGVYLEEGRAIVDDLAIIEGDNKTVGIELHIGWNRIVRRIFESLGYAVEKLDRVVYAGLDKKDLGRGEWRFLKPEEIIKLKHFK